MEICSDQVDQMTIKFYYRQQTNSNEEKEHRRSRLTSAPVSVKHLFLAQDAI